MKILCPRCYAENDTEMAEAGRIHCRCGQWFDEQPDESPWIKSDRPSAAAPQTGPGIGVIVWPAILVIMILLAFLGVLPWLLAAFFILLAIAGAVVTQFSSQRKK